MGNNSEKTKKVKVNIKQLTKKIFTARITIFIISLAVLLVFIFKDYIFDEDSYITKIYSEGYQNDILSILVKLVLVLFVVFGFTSLAKVFILLGKDTKDNKKKTWYFLIGNLFKYISIISGIFAILTIFGVDTKALLAGAGVLTLIVGLGCQSLVADIVAGIFIMFEGNFQIGDIVVIDGFRGEILSIGIRTTKIKNDYGNIKIINNSNINDIVNNSRDLSLVCVEIGFDYGMNLDNVEKAVNANLNRIKNNVPTIIDGPYYKGVSAFKSSEIVIKFIAYCKEEDIYQTERDINRQLLIIFRENNIEMAFDQVTLSYRDK